MPSWMRRWAFLALGAVLLLISVFAALSQWSFRGHALHAEGVVVRFEYPPAGDARPAWTVIEFKTATGRTIPYSSQPLHAYGIDDRVPIIYDPEEPGMTAEIDAPEYAWSGAAISAALGVMFLLFGLLESKARAPEVDEPRANKFY